MKTTKIVDYRHELAGQVADMWNHSRDGWGGGNDISTAESVRQTEENSINLNTYLAMDGDCVAGYCGISEYREDSGALYIALLNVRAEYQGKKIGKELVLKAVDRTIELGWPRLDLYTWGGNTKAVPLYKKCGFFWENRDDTVHLMNFIPSVLTTEAVKGFFEKADWYNDRKLDMEIKPDGRKENGFDFYEYKWEKDGLTLRMEYERKGRGLRLIETDQYLIYAATQQQDLIYGMEYPVVFHIENKTNEPLDITLEGFDDQNIRFDFQKQLTVTDQAVVEGKFFVGTLAEEQNIWRTHPTVAAKVHINGKEAVFKLGINSKSPAQVRAKMPNELPLLETHSVFYFELESHFQENAQFNFTLPQAEFIEFEQADITVSLGAKERKLVPIPYRLNDYGYYQAPLKITAHLQSGEAIHFSKEIGLAFYGMGARIHGECEDYWHVYNGHSHAYLSKFDNRLYFARAGSFEGDVPFFFYPKLGKPFSSEFSKRRPEQVEFSEEKGAILLKAIYHSESFPDLKLHSIAKIFGEGLMEHHYEIHNLGMVATKQEIWLNDSHNFIQSLYETVLPYNGQFIKIDQLKDGNGDYWQGENLHENWIFKSHSENPSGFCWSDDVPVKFQHWFLFFEHNLGVIPSGGSARTKSVYLSAGAFPTWEAFRTFAIKKASGTKVSTTQPVVMYPEGHNPFVDKKTSIHYKDYKFAHLAGALTLLVDGQESSLEQQFLEEDAKNEAVFPVHFENETGLKLVEVNANLNFGSTEHRTLLILSEDGEIQTNQYSEKGMTVYEVSNGLIQLKAAPDFFPSLYSLNFKGTEWLDTSFPEPIPKSWWNPWPGGIRNSLINLSGNSLLKEERTCEFVSITDDKGNRWQGLKLQTSVLQHETYKGLTYNQYFLLQPGVPVMCHTTEVLQNTQRFFRDEIWYCQTALHMSPFDADQKGYIGHSNGKAYFGKEEMEINVKQSFNVSHDAASDRLQVISDYKDGRADIYLNKEVAHFNSYSLLSLKHGERYWTAPIFYLFNSKAIPEDALQDLKNIRFK